FIFFTDTVTAEIYTLSLHDALPIFRIGSVGRHRPDDARVSAQRLSVDDGEARRPVDVRLVQGNARSRSSAIPEASARAGLLCRRSEEHTSELQSPCNLVCRLLLEKK